MAVRITKHDDGISRWTTIRGTNLERLDYFMTHFQSWGFEHSIGACEKYWLGVPARKNATPLSLAWYRERILRDIAYVRRIVALRDSAEPLRHKNLEAWILAAMKLGKLLTEAQWRFALGDDARRDRKQMRTLQKNAPVGLETIQRKKTDRDAALRAAVRAVDLKQPELTRRSVAAYLIRHSPEDGPYRKLSIDALTRRITRLTPTEKKTSTSRK